MGSSADTAALAASSAGRLASRAALLISASLPAAPAAAATPLEPQDSPEERRAVEPLRRADRSESGGVGVAVPERRPVGSDSKSDSSVMTNVGLTWPASGDACRVGSGDAVEPLSGVTVPRAWGRHRTGHRSDDTHT